MLGFLGEYVSSTFFRASISFDTRILVDTCWQESYGLTDKSSNLGIILDLLVKCLDVLGESL